MAKEWFATWFNTRYYHLLYRNRNEVEARRFIDALLLFLDPAPGSTFLDIACGKGRHSIYLNSKGYDVTGLDLSKNSIAEAKKCSQNLEGIRFMEHDIREPFPVSNIDYAVNLFTSFGYFKNDEEHLIALQNIHKSIRKGGTFVLDYLNVSEVQNNLKNEEFKEIDGVQFRINRSIQDGQIVKRIHVQDGDESSIYEEIVRAFSKDDLCRLMESTGFSILNEFGDYGLSPYHQNSARALIIAQKTA